MENVDILISALEPEIDKKCSEIKRKKSERLLTKVFIWVSGLMLIIPALLIFFGIGLITVFVPIVFTGAVFLAVSPILMSKGEENYEQV